jgi:hypothetical protein
LNFNFDNCRLANTAFCNKYLAAERFDLDVPSVIPKSLALSILLLTERTFFQGKSFSNTIGGKTI